jgi:anthranilate synthase component II
MSDASVAPSTARPVDLVMIDNYDSFTYNIVQYFEELGAHVTVFRHDQITLDELEALSPTRIVISPGPGAPKDAGVSCDVIRRFAGRVPILGVCLGVRSEAQGESVSRGPYIITLRLNFKPQDSSACSKCSAV